MSALVTSCNLFLCLAYYAAVLSLLQFLGRRCHIAYVSDRQQYKHTKTKKNKETYHTDEIVGRPRYPYLIHCEPKKHTKMFFDIQSTKPDRL